MTLPSNVKGHAFACPSVFPELLELFGLRQELINHLLHILQEESR